MKYAFVNSPIADRRVDRRTGPEKRRALERAEKKREELQESFSVPELIAMGFYEDKKKPSPFGVEVTTVRTEQMDKDWRELHTVLAHRITLRLPDGASRYGLKALVPSRLEGEDAYYWKYKIYNISALWVIFDLLTRILDLLCWDDQETIPLYWGGGVEKVLERGKRFLPEINQRSLNLAMPKPSAISLEALERRTKREMQLRFHSHRIGKITNKAMISYLRHHYTPYDYLWQTAKMSREDAKTACNDLIRSNHEFLWGNA